MFHISKQHFSKEMPGPALIAVGAKGPPLTARCLSLLLGFECRHGHVRKLPLTWG